MEVYSALLKPVFLKFLMGMGGLSGKKYLKL